MFNYDSIDAYIADIRNELVQSAWHYSKDTANELIAKRMAWIKEAFEKQESAWETAMDVGYCCG